MYPFSTSVEEKRPKWPNCINRPKNLTRNKELNTLLKRSRFIFIEYSNQFSTVSLLGPPGCDVMTVKTSS